MIGIRLARSAQVFITYAIVGAALMSGAASADEISAFRDIRITAVRNLQSEQSGMVRADVQEAADILNITSYITRLRQEHTSSSVPLPRSTQILRLICLHKIFRASEEVRKMIAQINFDLAISNSELGNLTAKRNQVSNLLNTINFMQGGILGVTKNSLSLAQVHRTGQQIIGMTNFGTGTLLAAANTIIPSVWSYTSDGKPNTLAIITSTKYEPIDAKQSYLWRFLNSPIPGAPASLTRRQIIEKHWQSFAGLSASPEVQAVVARTAPSGARESITTIGRRVELLHDLKSHLEEFDGVLFELQQSITMESTK